MSNSQAIQAIENVLATSKVGVLSTAYNNKPNSRYMVFYNDGLILYTKCINGRGLPYFVVQGNII